MTDLKSRLEKVGKARAVKYAGHKDKADAASCNEWNALVDSYQRAHSDLAVLVAELARELEGVIEELEVFLGVSHKIHFPEARQKLETSKKALASLEAYLGEGEKP